MTFTMPATSRTLAVNHQFLRTVWLFTVGGLTGLWLTDAAWFAGQLSHSGPWWAALIGVALLIPVLFLGLPQLTREKRMGLLLVATALLFGFSRTGLFQSHPLMPGALLLVSGLLIGLLLSQTVSLSRARAEDRYVVRQILGDFFLLYAGAICQLGLLLVSPTPVDEGSLTWGYAAMPLLALVSGIAWHISGGWDVPHSALLAPGKRKYLWRNNVWRNGLVAALFLGIGLGAIWEAAPMLVTHYQAMGALLAGKVEALASVAPFASDPAHTDMVTIASMLAGAIFVAGAGVWWCLRRWRSRPIFNVLTAAALAALMAAAFVDGMAGFAGFVAGCALFAMLIPFTVAYSLRYLSADVPLAASLWLAIATIGYTSGTAITSQVLTLADPGLGLLLPALCITVLMWFSADGSRYQSII